MIRTTVIKEFFVQNNLFKNLGLSLVSIFVFSLLFYAFFILFDHNAILYFSLAFGLAAALSLLFLLAFFYPSIYLLIALICIYNPYYLYLVLTNWWEYAGVRVGISAFFIILFFIAIFFKVTLQGRIKRFKTPLDAPLLTFLFFPVVATASGFFLGNPSRLILADLFPIIEFIAYFFIATIVIKNLKQTNLILKGILFWLLLTGLGGIIFYFFAPLQLGYQAAPGGVVVRRLADFMAAIALPLLAALYFYIQPKRIGLINKKRLLILSLSLIPLLSLLLGFFRSLWIGVVGALIFIFLMVCRQKRHLKAILVALLLIGIILFSIDYFIISKTQIFKGKSLSFLISERISPEPTELVSVYGRLQANLVLLSAIYESPLIGHGLGSFMGYTNYYLVSAARMGLPALFILLWLAFIFIKSGIQIFNRLQGIYKGWVLGIFASFLSVALYVINFTAVLHFPTFAYLGVLAACLFIFPQVLNKKIRQGI